jgi:sulfopyruvate decarboxylase beta subunit
LQNPEESLLKILAKAGVDFVSTLPCEKIKSLLLRVEKLGVHVPLTREEEGVGISAGAALAGRRPAMFIQSSGLGNMINALLSLTQFYSLPLAIFISRRGIYQEKISAQVPMGKASSKLLEAAGIEYTEINEIKDPVKVERSLKDVYKREKIHAFLLSPALWEGCAGKERDSFKGKGPGPKELPCPGVERPNPQFKRFEIIKIISPFLKGNVVICNLGIPSKELYSILDQPSNFYMLGSMGMATPIGLGEALSTSKKVYVIDGDGSILMNPGTLGTAALMAPKNLTIICIDNGSYGSTGDQPTHTASVTNLARVAAGFGIKYISIAGDEKEITASLKKKAKGPHFVHILARPGNADVPNIPLSAEEIKRRFKRFFS